jgi:hypothetical protein
MDLTVNPQSEAQPMVSCTRVLVFTTDLAALCQAFKPDVLYRSHIQGICGREARKSKTCSFEKWALCHYLMMGITLYER